MFHYPRRALFLICALLLPMLAACAGTPATPAATAVSSAATTVATVAMPQATEAPKPTDAPTATVAPVQAASTSEAGVLRMVIIDNVEPDNVDPQKSIFISEIQFIMLNYQALMTFDTNMKPIPAAAEKVDVSQDGLTYTFHLRPNMKYSNGEPLTAKNFEFGWKRLADPATAGGYQFLGCDLIKGYSEYSAATCQGKTMTETQALDLNKLRDALGIKALDDNTLEIELIHPAPYFLSIAALWAGMPVREADAQNADALGQGVVEHYIGNGPFKMVEHERDHRSVWEPNPNYVGPLGPLKLKQIILNIIPDTQVAFQAYRNGDLDIVRLAPEDQKAVMADPTLSKEIVNIPGSCTEFIGLNVTRPPFDKVMVRQAFAQAIDRNAFVRDVLQEQGVPAQTFIPPGFPGYEKSDQWSFNPEAAKKTLAEAGYPDGKGLPPLKVSFASSPREKVRFEWYANQFKQNLGVDVQLDPIDPTAYDALTKSPETMPQMYSLGWCADYPDPQDWLTLTYKTGGFFSANGGFTNKSFDELVTKADIEADPAQRAALYSQAQKLLIEEAPVIFMFHNNVPTLVKPTVKLGKTTPIDYIPGFFQLAKLDVQP